MKKYLNINYWKSAFMLSVLAVMFFCTSCEDESKYEGAINVDQVYLEDASSSVTDREVTFIRKGQLMRLEGSGFTDLLKVYINGYDTYFNPVYVTNTSMLVKVSSETPIVEAEPDDRNIIKLINKGSEFSLNFDIRDAAPSITNISHTLPNVGEEITVLGSGLQEVSKVVFPGDIEVTSGIVSDLDGEFFTVTMPEGVSEEGGSIFIECANGGAYSPAYFNFKEGVILDFDGLGQHGFWGSSDGMIQSDDIESGVIGTGTISQGNYVPHRPARISSFDGGKARCSEVWTAGNDVDDWRGQLTPYIPSSTPVDEVAFQFDIYVPQEWESTGFLKVCLFNAFNGGEWAGACYNYIPWIIDGEIVPFETVGWTTITVPFSSFYAFSEDEGDFTFEDVLVARESTSWKNFGIYFENLDFNLGNITGEETDEETTFPSSSTAIDVYTDNWRVVSIDKPSYSDFPEDE